MYKSLKLKFLICFLKIKIEPQQNKLQNIKKDTNPNACKKKSEIE